MFAIDVLDANLWIVYGGYDGTYTPVQNRQGFSHFDGEQWINTPYDPNFPLGDLSAISIDPNHENRVYIFWGYSSNQYLPNWRLVGGRG